jgi:hypothetical protein
VAGVLHLASLQRGSLILRESSYNVVTPAPTVGNDLVVPDSKRERGGHARYALLLGTRSAGGGRRPGLCGRTVTVGPPLALAASRGPGLTHSTFPARQRRAMGRIEHTLLVGDGHPNRPKTFARNPTIPHKSDKRFYLPQRAGVLRALIQDPANGLLRILLPRTL